MTSHRHAFDRFLIVLMVGLLLGLPARAIGASDMPQAAGSPTAGITFDDRPLMLPVQRNFQMAMLTASSELGRSCSHMEAYGWRMGNNEQQRVNQIFNNTVDRMRAQGFSVETKAPNSVSRDVTIFTADRPDKHLIFMWSAGEIGLVMVLCETSAPLYSTPHTLKAPENANSPFAANQAIRSGRDYLPLTRTGKNFVENFSPVGDWVGSYTCMQGTTGGTLTVSRVRGDQFEGFFRFYPTPKNPYVPTGRYAVFGEYDRESQRILINPGKWLQRPKDYFNTIMIGSFDPVAKTFSGFFQGINGCTSFEAHYSSDSSATVTSASSKVKRAPAKTLKAKAKKPKAKKKVVKTEPTPIDSVKEALDKNISATTKEKPAPSPAPSPIVEEPAGIDLGTHIDMPKLETTKPEIQPAPAAPSPAIAPTAPAEKDLLPPPATKP